MNKRERRTACTRQPRAVPDRHARYQTEKVGTPLPVEFSCLRYEKIKCWSPCQLIILCTDNFVIFQNGYIAQLVRASVLLAGGKGIVPLRAISFHLVITVSFACLTARIDNTNEIIHDIHLTDSLL